MTESSHAPSIDFLRSAYEHCARISIGTLTSRGELPPQLFFVGTPKSGDDAQTSPIAAAGEQAMRLFHGSPESLKQLETLIADSFKVSTERGKALARQLGKVQVVIHACHALVTPEPERTPPPQGTQELVRPDGRIEALVISIHLPEKQHVQICPVYKTSDGQLQSFIREFDWV